MSRLLILNPADPNYPYPKECTMWDEIGHPDEMDKLLLDKNHAQIQLTH